jgi:hypothetical protein
MPFPAASVLVGSRGGATAGPRTRGKAEESSSLREKRARAPPIGRDSDRAYFFRVSFARRAANWSARSETESERTASDVS